MEERVSYAVSELGVYSFVIPVLLGLYRYFWGASLLTHQKVLLILLLLSSLTEIVSYWIASQEVSQAPIYFTYTIIEYLLLTYIFSQGVRPLLSRQSLGGISLGFVVFVMADIIWLSGLSQFNSYSTAVEGLILITYALIFYYKTLTELRIEHLEREPLFWISTGVLLYFASSLFIFLFTNYVKSSDRALYIIWGLHGIFGILLNIFYSIALWVTPKP